MIKLKVSEELSGERADKIVRSALLHHSRTELKDAFSGDLIRRVVGDRRAKVSKGDLLNAGDELEISLEPRSGQEGATPEAIPLTIALDRADLVVVNKPAGMPTAPLHPEETGTLAGGILHAYPETRGIGFSPLEPGLCHRLDTDTSGLVLVAKTQDAFQELTAALKSDHLDKRYLLICASEGLPERGSIEIPLANHPKDQKRVLACVHPRDVARCSPKPAKTDYETLEVRGAWALVEVKAPRAHRHQIRAHFEALGFPLVGDSLYGGPQVEGLARHALHASQIRYAGGKLVPKFDVRAQMAGDLQDFWGAQG